ncbi:DUF4145 domain-containing protein [Isoptericola chiayiensis]|uniref:DUF4145 domain-containing protein n=1 Tax=Isoptericola chiayiensis TaxID=579446 RepID=A0ABP8YH24_9MICO|nr:DUF4145 domain-containing protein [Isoptericola chiayiensis]NOW00183.1 hypothetical protein [Isoptericola chiayiensis]
MTRNATPYADWFDAEDWPETNCPQCTGGILAVETVQNIESNSSSRLRDHDAWEPEWISGFFIVQLRCQTPRCHELTVAHGDWRVAGTGWSDEGIEYSSLYHLRSTLPPLPIIEIPDSCPSEVRDSVTKAAQIIWCDAGAAASRLRFAIEHILDDQNIPRTRSSTHRRIENFRQTNTRAAEILEAVKWIGNQGTHEESLTTADVLEGAKILEHGLTLLYDSSADGIRQRALEINRARGVRKT